MIDARIHRPTRPACVVDPLVTALNDLKVAVAAGARFIDADTYADYRAALKALRNLT